MAEAVRSAPLGRHRSATAAARVLLRAQSGLLWCGGDNRVDYEFRVILTKLLHALAEVSEPAQVEQELLRLSRRLGACNGRSSPDDQSSEFIRARNAWERLVGLSQPVCLFPASNKL